MPSPIKFDKEESKSEKVPFEEDEDITVNVSYDEELNELIESFDINDEDEFKEEKKPTKPNEEFQIIINSEEED